MHIDWTVRLDMTKETRNQYGFVTEPAYPRIVPSGHYRFSLCFHDVETRLSLGSIDGFRISRDFVSVLPPASRGIKNEIYHFVNFSPEWLGMIRDQVRAEFDKEREEADKRSQTNTRFVL